MTRETRQEEISLVELHRDCYANEESVRILVSANLRQFFLEILDEQDIFLLNEYNDPTAPRKLIFMGKSVVECDMLQGMEYAFVKCACEHEFVDARNEFVKSGEICLKCGALRATNDEEN